MARDARKKGTRRGEKVLDVPAHHLLCAVCVVGGCKDPPAGIRTINRIIRTTRAHPAAPLRLLADIEVCRAHYNDVYSGGGRRTGVPDFRPRQRDIVGRFRDLWVMRRLGLRPNAVHPALDVIKRLFSRIKSLEGICYQRRKSSDNWPECPHARKGYFKKVRGNGKYDVRLGEKLEGKGPYALLPIRTRAEMRQAKKESCKTIAEADRLFVRAHHLMCILCSWAAGHLETPLAEDNLQEVLARMREDPDISVTVTEGCCMVCDPCPHYWADGNLCLHSEIKDQLKDLLVFRKLDLRPGATLKAGDLYKLLFRRVKSPKEICGWGDMEETSPLWGICGTCRTGGYERVRDSGSLQKFDGQAGPATQDSPDQTLSAEPLAPVKHIDLDLVRERKPVQELLEFSIVNVDKPAGPTSFVVAERVKRALGLKKTGHFGTLDPMVTGVLPVALNRACRLTRWFITKRKTYVGVMRLHAEVDSGELERWMARFVGKIQQMPPVRSRVKRQTRQREVFSWKVLERQGRNVTFSCEVEAGTYVRKLISDLGEHIDGAHMARLRRTRAGLFAEDDKRFVTLEQVEEAAQQYKRGDESKLREMLIPAEIISRILPVLRVREDATASLLVGHPVRREDVVDRSEGEGDCVAVFAGEKFIEVATLVEGNDVVAKPDFVFT